MPPRAMPKVTVEEWIAKYIAGVRAGAAKYVEHAERYGVPKLRRYAGPFLQAHAAAPYVPAPATDPERLRNVQTSWNVTRSVRAQYRGRAVAGLAAAITA